MANPDPGFIGGYGSVLDPDFRAQLSDLRSRRAGDAAHSQPHRRGRPGARRTAGEAVRDPPAPVAEPGAPGGGRCADRHAPRARQSTRRPCRPRALQQESLAAEQAKFEVGASTSFFVIQYESLLAQARSTEVAAQSSYVKAKAALQRATGTILDENNISIEAAIKGK